jgi:hypothetical protein
MEPNMNTDKSNVVRAYSGKPGCMCGCRGKYFESGAGVTRTYNAVMNHPKVTVDRDAKCAFVLSNTGRNLVVWFKD